MEVLIIIVTYNGLHWIDKCLNSCKQYRTVVIDNNSTDETVLFIKTKYPKVKIIEQQKNLGFGAANNIGMSYAIQQSADYIFLLNQDAYLQNNTIENLISVYKQNLDFGILSPLHLNGLGNKLDRNFSYYFSHDYNDTFYFDAIHKKLKPVYEIPFVNAAAWLIPKKTLELIGGFDPIFFHYGEDDNYCQRVLFHKLKIGVCSNSFVYHDREMKTLKIKESAESRLLKLEKTLKIKWANINEDNFEEINFQKKILKRKILKLKLKLKFSVAKKYEEELELIKRVESEIMKSRSINIKLGSHYI